MESEDLQAKSQIKPLVRKIAIMQDATTLSADTVL